MAILSDMGSGFKPEIFFVSSHMLFLLGPGARISSPIDLWAGLIVPFKMSASVKIY